MVSCTYCENDSDEVIVLENTGNHPGGHTTKIFLCDVDCLVAYGDRFYKDSAPYCDCCEKSLFFPKNKELPEYYAKYYGNFICACAYYGLDKYDHKTHTGQFFCEELYCDENCFINSGKGTRCENCHKACSVEAYKSDATCDSAGKTYCNSCATGFVKCAGCEEKYHPNNLEQLRGVYLCKKNGCADDARMH